MHDKSDKAWQVSIVLVTDEYLATMHEQYLDDATPTDVITFNLSESFEDYNEGEIYISVDRAKDQAGNYNVSIESELYRLMIHGMLHLTGLDDQTETEKANMRSKEDEILQKFNLL